MISTSSPAARLVILYGIGGLSDVGRHAIQVALRERSEDEVSSVKVLTQHPELLELPNWECGCETPHDNFAVELEKKRLEIVHVKSWEDEKEELSQHFSGATSVISCLGNRQPGLFNSEIKKGWCAYEGNDVVIHAMKQNNINRAVVITSMGVEEDWPPLEFHWAGKLMSFLFLTNTKKAFDDLTRMERAYRSAQDFIDFLFVRPVGISEDCKPVGRWLLQKEKYKDPVGFNMAKLDVARYMVEEALKPTRHKDAVVIGALL